MMPGMVPACSGTFATGTRDVVRRFTVRLFS